MHTGAYLGNIMVQLTEDDIQNIYKARQAEIDKIAQQMERIVCPICKNSEPIHLVEARCESKLGQCPICDVVYAYERQTVFLSNALYKYYLPSNLTNAAIRESQLITRPQELNEDLDCIEKYTERGSMLDIGASSGDFLAYARVRGWQVEATELSELCADFMARTLNILVMLGNILDINFQDKKYDAITLRHSIEHLRDPVKELEVLYNVLDDNGAMLITTPEHAKDLELVTREHMLPLHLVNYTEDTLKLLLNKTGFKMVSYESQETGREIKNMRTVATKVV